MKICSLNRTINLTVITFITLGQLGCATSVISTDTGKKPATSASASTTAPADLKTQLQVNTEKSFSLTQRDSDGVTRAIVPEDIESITVNGVTIKASEFNIKNGFKTKSWSGYWTWNTTSKTWVWTWVWYADSKGWQPAATDDFKLNFSFKLKDSGQVIVPDLELLGLTGDLRLEFIKNDKGEVIGLTGGINNDGNIDTSKPFFRYDYATGKLDVISNNAILTYFLETADLKTEFIVKTEAVKTGLNAEQLKQEEERAKVGQPSEGAKFAGKWKYNELGILIGLNISGYPNPKIQLF